MEWNKTHKTKIAVLCKNLRDFKYYVDKKKSGKFCIKYSTKVVIKNKVYYAITNVKDIQGLSVDEWIMYTYPKDFCEILSFLPSDGWQDD
jgi:hypothetical protein